MIGIGAGRDDDRGHYRRSKYFAAVPELDFAGCSFRS
jgi:hypothetical protein